MRISKIIGVDIGDTVSWFKDVSIIDQAVAYAYQAVLAGCWKMGGKLGDICSRSVAKVFRYPGSLDEIHSGMSYPYVMFRYAGKDSFLENLTSFEPDCPFLFIYGARSPIESFSKVWAEKLANKPENQFIAFEKEHWVMLEAPEKFNRVVIDWLSKE